MQSLSLCTKIRKKHGSNYRGITILSVAGKILARVLLNRFISILAQGEHARKTVWVEAQQRDSRRDLRAEADTGEIQRTEHGSIRSFLKPDRGF